MTSLKSITQYLDSIAPPGLQEDYDNSGLLVGDPKMNVSGVLICLDSTEDIISEAVEKKCNVVVAHHPIIFKGLKKLTGANYVERTILKAIENKVAIYSIHTNLDNVKHGVNHKICQKLGLKNTTILSPKTNTLNKLVTFVPETHKNDVLNAIFDAGAGEIGDYENCAFTSSGTGQYRPRENAKPYSGKPGKDEKVEEVRVEVIFEKYKSEKVIRALNDSHPYEEVAYYITQLQNNNQQIGSGMIGELKNPMTVQKFLEHIKSSMNTNTIRFTKGPSEIRKVAVCGGAGSFLIAKAKAAQADAFVTGDVKYHEFFDAENNLLIADIGHYESEVFTKDLIHELLTKKFTTFAVNLAETDTNPINYF